MIQSMVRSDVAVRNRKDFLCLSSVMGEGAEDADFSANGYCAVEKPRAVAAALFRYL